MDIARVIGTVVATAKSERLTGHKLLVVVRTSREGEEHAPAYVALDTVGAGVGEVVLVARGSAARVESGDAPAPVDAAIVAIVDRIDVDGRPTFQKEG